MLAATLCFPLCWRWQGRRVGIGCRQVTSIKGEETEGEEAWEKGS